MRDPHARQAIRYLHAPDGARLAWAEAGRGPTLVKASNWMTHLELEWDSPVWRHWLRFLSGNFRFVRYDERGCGMSDWDARDLSASRWVEDLTAVVDTACDEGKITLLGISQGTVPAIEYAARHAERVSHLVLYGGYSQGWMKRGDDASRRRYAAMVELIEQGWGKSNPVFRQLFTSRFIPGGSDEQLEWFNELCRKTTSPRNAARLLETRANVDIRDLLGEVRVPTLVLHARDDDVVPIRSGTVLASEIPGAQFVELDSANHILLEGEPAWGRFCDAVLEFAGIGGRQTNAEDMSTFDALTPREREVLGLICEGLANAEIADRLGIREKTVRNHVSNVFDKLGVWTRAQAIVFSRDRGYR